MHADPDRCPDCSAPLDGSERCPSCDLALRTPEAAAVWRALLTVDERVAAARLASVRTAEREPVGAWAGTAGLAELIGPAAPEAPRPAARAGSRWSAGGIVLGLGALCLVVAGIIFVGVAWGSLGVGARAAVLVGVTAVFAGLSTLVTRRRLRGSAEALWAVTLALVAIDWFAAVGFDLLGLGALSDAASAALWSVVMLGVAVAVTRGLRIEGVPDLVIPSVVAGLAVWVLAIAGPVLVADHTSTPDSVLTGLALLVAVGGWSAVRTLGLSVSAVIALVAIGVATVVAVLTAAVEAISHPSLEELLRGHGVALLVVAVVLVAGGARLARTATPASTAATTVGSLAAVLLVCLPVADAWPDGGLVVPSSLVAVAGAWLCRGRGPLPLAGRIVSGSMAVLLGLISLSWAGQTADVLYRVIDPVADESWTQRLEADDLIDAWPAWAALVVTAALVLTVLGARRWPGNEHVRPHLRPCAVWVGALGLLATVVSADPTLLVLVVSVGALVTGLAVVLHRTPGWRWSALVVVALAPALGASVPSVLVALGGLTVVVATVMGLGSDAPWCRRSVAVAALWTSLVVLGLADLLELSRLVTGIAEAALVALLLAAAASLRGRVQREGLEVATALPILLAVAVGSPTAGASALVLTMLGASLVAAGLVVADRRLLVVPGTVALGAAYVLRLVASDVSLVEAYTLPFAILLLAAGGWAMRDDSRGSVAVAPGLTLALVPSLVLVLDDPVSVRGLLLGIASVAVLLVGLRRRWQWPFLIGSVVAAAIVVRHLGPQAAGLPRWVVIAAVGALLLGIGVTWDRRVQDGRAAVRLVTSMR